MGDKDKTNPGKFDVQRERQDEVDKINKTRR